MTPTESAEYFAKWFFAKSIGIDPLDREVAERRHRDGEPYVALLKVNGKRAHLVDIAGPWVSVSFFDADERLYLRYDFTTHSSGKVFLKGATHQGYSDSSESMASLTSFNFQLDGSYIAVRRVGSTEKQVEGRSDPAPLWSERPRFGEYGDLCRVERVPKNVV